MDEIKITMLVMMFIWNDYCKTLKPSYNCIILLNGNTDHWQLRGGFLVQNCSVNQPTEFAATQLCTTSRKKRLSKEHWLMFVK